MNKLVGDTSDNWASRIERNTNNDLEAHNLFYYLFCEYCKDISQIPLFNKLTRLIEDNPRLRTH